VFEQALVSDARVTFRTVEMADALRAVRLRQLPEGAVAEALYLHLAARRAPREQFASRADRRRYFIWQLQRGIAAAGAAAFVACALLGGLRWLDAWDTRQRASAQTREARTASSQYERITATFPVTQTSTENLKVAVQEFSRIAERNPSPEATLLHVSRVLEQFPQMEIDTLTWSVAERRDGRPASAPAPAKPAGAGDGLQIELSGRVHATQRNDYRGITAQVQRFAQALATSGYELVRTQLPFDITSEGVLTGDIGGRDSGEAPRFTVIVARRLP
jgi:hypothetical protein